MGETRRKRDKKPPIKPTDKLPPLIVAKEKSLNDSQRSFCRGIIDRMLEDETSLSFSKPVNELWDISVLSDYFDKIKKPMDLGTVKKHINSSKYNLNSDSDLFDPNQFREEARLVFLNAIFYNGKNSDLGRLGTKFIHFIDAECEKLPIPKKSKHEQVQDDEDGQPGEGESSGRQQKGRARGGADDDDDDDDIDDEEDDDDDDDTGVGGSSRKDDGDVDIEHERGRTPKKSGVKKGGSSNNTMDEDDEEMDDDKINTKERKKEKGLSNNKEDVEMEDKSTTEEETNGREDKGVDDEQQGKHNNETKDKFKERNGTTSGVAATTKEEDENEGEDGQGRNNDLDDDDDDDNDNEELNKEKGSSSTTNNTTTTISSTMMENHTNNEVERTRLHDDIHRLTKTLNRARANLAEIELGKNMPLSYEENSKLRDDVEALPWELSQKVVHILRKYVDQALEETNERDPEFVTLEFSTVEPRLLREIEALIRPDPRIEKEKMAIENAERDMEMAKRKLKRLNDATGGGGAAASGKKKRSKKSR